VNVVNKILDAFKFCKGKKNAGSGISRRHRVLRRDGPSSTQIMATREWVLEQIENAMNDDDDTSVSDEPGNDSQNEEPESGVA